MKNKSHLFYYPCFIMATYSAMIVFFGAEFTKVYSDFIHGRMPVSTANVKENPKIEYNQQKDNGQR